MGETLTLEIVILAERRVRSVVRCGNNTWYMVAIKGGREKEDSTRTKDGLKILCAVYAPKARKETCERMSL